MSQDSVISSLTPNVKVKWLRTYIGGNDSLRVCEAYHQHIKAGSVDPSDDKRLYEACGTVINAMQKQDDTWKKLLPQFWSLEYPKYKGVYNIVKREATQEIINTR